MVDKNKEGQPKGQLEYIILPYIVSSLSGSDDYGRSKSVLGFILSSFAHQK